MSASGVPVWAEWWVDGAKVYLSGEEYENIRVFEADFGYLKGN